MSICQRAFGQRPRGFTPNGGDGLDVRQFGHNLTICLAASLGYETHALNQLHFDGEFCENFCLCPSFYVHLKQLL